nr:hypothetical protein CFP56_32416 [Quercus suber]
MCPQHADGHAYGTWRRNHACRSVQTLGWTRKCRLVGRVQSGRVGLTSVGAVFDYRAAAKLRTRQRSDSLCISIGAGQFSGVDLQQTAPRDEEARLGGNILQVG